MINKELDTILKNKIFYDMDEYKCHIIWHNEEVIVWKYYGVHRHNWYYNCCSFYMFKYNIGRANFTIIKALTNNEGK